MIEHRKRPEFTVEVVENGFIMSTFVPAQGKEVEIRGTSVYRSPEQLYDAMSAFLLSLDQKELDTDQETVV